MARLDEAKVAGMSGVERRAVRGALAAAYPNRGRLNGVDTAFVRYAAEDEFSPEIEFKVVERAKTKGWLPRRLAGAAAVVARSDGG